MWIGSEMKIPLHQEDLRRPTLELSAVEPCLSAQLDFISAFDDLKHYWISKNLASQHGGKISSEKKVETISQDFTEKLFLIFLLSKNLHFDATWWKNFPSLLLFLSWNVLENILFRLNCKLSKSPCFVEWKISKPNEH